MLCTLQVRELKLLIYLLSRIKGAVPQARNPKSETRAPEPNILDPNL